MEFLYFIISSILFSLFFFCILDTNKIKTAIKDSNFITYTRNKILISLDAFGCAIYILSLDLLLEERSLYNKWSFILVVISNIVLGYVLYYSFTLWLERKSRSQSLHRPPQTYDFNDALSVLGIGGYSDIENLTTISLEYGKLSIFEYCDKKIFCEEYLSGIVHTVYYINSECSQHKNYLLKDCIPCSNISYWKNFSNMHHFSD